MNVASIKTDAGNQILDQLKREGWRVVAEYSRLAFDKGIDFDSFTLAKDDQRLQFEWTNWLEWEVTGSEPALNDLISRFDLASTPVKPTP